MKVTQIYYDIKNGNIYDKTKRQYITYEDDEDFQKLKEQLYEELKKDCRELNNEWREENKEYDCYPFDTIYNYFENKYGKEVHMSIIFRFGVYDAEYVTVEEFYLSKGVKQCIV